MANKIEWAINKRTGKPKNDVVVVDDKIEFHLSADGYGVYGVCKVGGDTISSIQKPGWPKKVYKLLGKQVDKFIRTPS